MTKNCGVCLCLVALGLAGIGAPATRAEKRLAAGDPGTAVTSTTSSPSTAAELNAADLRQRIEALKAELSDLDAQLASTDGDTTAPADVPPQDQGGGSAAPAQTPAAGAPAAAPAAAAAPMPLSSPSMSGPLATAVPHEIPAGPFGKLEVTGVLSGFGLAQGEHVPGDKSADADISNAQVFVQKTTGWFQFYLQGGAYNIPDLGTAFAPTGFTTTNLYGAFPQGYLKLVKGNFNVEVGALPTLIGAEYTFDFENMNIERGLLWNQENAVNRGVQLNETYKKVTLAFSWNDGFYSNRYNWLSGSLAYAFNASNTLTFVGMGNAGSYDRTSAVTPELLNNSMIYNVLYTYSHGNWIINPYYQYTAVKKNTALSIPITEGAHTNGGALLLNYNFKHGISLPWRVEYIKSSGNALDPNAINLMYGPGTGAFSFTVTPTWVKDDFFFRGEFSIAHVTNFTASNGFAFGLNGTNLNQARGLIEVGVLF